MEAELYKIIIFLRDILAEAITLHNIEEHYCTDKMFYARDNSGCAHYYLIDLIREIHVSPENEEEI